MSEKNIVNLGEYADLGWNKIFGDPKIGLPWTFDIEGTATVVTDGGDVVQGHIVSIDHVVAAIIENAALGHHVYAESPGGWCQTFFHQFKGGALTALYSIVDGKVFVATIPTERFLCITDGKPTVLHDMMGRFVGKDNTADDAIISMMKAIPGLEGVRFIWPLPKFEGEDIEGTITQRAFDLVVDDEQSNKLAVIYVPADALRQEGDNYVLDVDYDPPMPPETDENEQEINDIKFLKKVTKATFMRASRLGLKGKDGIMLTQAMRVVSGIDEGLLPTE